MARNGLPPFSRATTPATGAPTRSPAAPPALCQQHGSPSPAWWSAGGCPAGWWSIGGCPAAQRQPVRPPVNSSAPGALCAGPLRRAGAAAEAARPATAQTALLARKHRPPGTITCIACLSLASSSQVRSSAVITPCAQPPGHSRGFPPVPGHRSRGQLLRPAPPARRSNVQPSDRQRNGGVLAAHTGPAGGLAVGCAWRQ